jgi:transposase
MVRGNISYSGKRVFIGIDVHKSFYVLSAVCEGKLVKTCRVPARAEDVVKLFKKYFAGAEVKAC